MTTKTIRVMVSNWLLFLLSPIAIILINSITLFKLVNLGGNRSGSYTPLGSMIIILLYSLFLLGIIFYLSIWKFAKNTTLSPQQNHLCTKITGAYTLLVLCSIAFVDLSKFSPSSITVSNIVELLGLIWIISLTVKTLKSTNQSFLKFQIISQIFLILLFLNSFYGWNV